MEKFLDEGESMCGIFNTTPVDEKFKKYCHQVDIRDINEIQQFIKKAQHLSQIVLINCAGINYNSFAHKSDLSKWREVIDTNVIGTFYFIYFLLPIMRKEEYGRIINFSSVVTQIPTPGISSYATSKAALVGLTKSLSVENASKGITVNTISLGYTNAGMGINDIPQRYKEEILTRIPKRRLCEPLEIYKTIQYIIDTEYITGATINVNGGLY